MEDYHYYLRKNYYEIPENYLKHNLKVVKWLKAESEYVNEGDALMILGYQTSYRNDETLTHFAKASGYLNRMVSWVGLGDLRENDLVYILHSDDRKRIDMKFQNVPDIIADDFTGSKAIKWQRVGAMDGYHQAATTKSLDGKHDLLITFNFSDQKDHIVFQYYPKEMKVAEGDVISLLLANAQILDFSVNEKPYKAAHRFINGLYETRVPLLGTELDLLCQHFVTKWKVALKKENRTVLGGEAGQYGYSSHQNLMEVIHKLSNDYRAVVRREIAGYTPLILRETLSASEKELLAECFVYLMHDTVNGFYKIGISNSPEWREKTLQSEKPTIELLAAKKFIRRKLAAAFEKALHETYSEKRLRGEWFQLSPEDVADICITLK